MGDNKDAVIKDQVQRTSQTSLKTGTLKELVARLQHQISDLRGIDFDDPDDQNLL